ncbi:hypothetical protein PT974_02913 [Cladobotryum mycophilum]|uniref:Uncharacterized protein n=1 Tax=Cladobotryum mycophilum TaxID=491253 RepID=A0ABR0T0L2_9HYPO
MSAMFDSGCVLSGSRALEFFIPGSARPDSDWDFYVPAYKESVIDMVNALQLCGVDWHMNADVIAADLFQEGKATMSRRMLEALHSWLDRQGDEAASASILGEQLYNIARVYRENTSKAPSGVDKFDMHLDSKNNISFVPHEQSSVRDAEEIPYNDPLGRSFNILHGEIQTSRGREKVQLIIGRYYAGIKGCMTFIKAFYASHVQCFIGGWCASHMYYSKASAKQATLWKPAFGKHDKKVLHAVKKYTKRGFLFTDAKLHGGPRPRTLTDNEAFHVDYGNIFREFMPEQYYPTLLDWLEKRRKNINTISWTEFGGRIVGLQSMMQGCYGANKTTFAKSRESGRLRLGNIIATNTESPNALRARCFRSSVGRYVLKSGWEMHTLARSGTVHSDFRDATPWSWIL